MNAKWEVRFAPEFVPETEAMAADVYDALAAAAVRLRELGPLLGRPHADTLKGSRHSNMKELRFSAAGGEWRVAFAFDVERKAILLVAGDKSGGSQKRFYAELIRKADDRFDAHILRLKEKR